MARTYRVEWAPAAIQDLDEILAYIAVEDGVEAAEHVYSRIKGRAATLDRVPSRGRVVPELRRFGVVEYRELVVAPYRICFRVTGHVVGIVGVLDARRDLEELLVNRLIAGR